MRSQVLSVRGVSVSLGGRPVLRDVSFEVGEGEFTGLIGSNGAGKTTLLRVILGLQRAGAGEVLLQGRRRSRGDASIGYVPQKFQLDPDTPLRARDLVGLGIDAQRLGLPWPSRARAQRVERMLAAVGALELANARVGELSGGEQQRVLIAHALVGTPRLLLLDEPLANLDLRAGKDVVALLAELTRELGVAVLISSHEMNALLGAMQRIVYLANGRAASGATDEVVRAEVLSELYGSHVDVLNVHGRVLVVAGAGDEHDLRGHEAALGEIEVISSSSLLAPVVEPGFFASEAVQTALVVGLIAAVVSATVGVFTVMRAQAFAGHALSDVGATGGAGAFLLGVGPLWGFVAAALLAAVGMEAIGIQRVRGRDLATGIVLGIALGVAALLLYLDTTQMNTSGATVTVLFGSISRWRAQPWRRCSRSASSRSRSSPCCSAR